MSSDPALQRVFDALFPGIALPAGVTLPRRRLCDGRSLFVQGQRTAAFYAVASGEIEARFTGVDGSVSALENIAPPRLFGLAAFAAGQPAGYEAVARGATEVLVIARDAYVRLMDEVPGFARALLAEFAHRHDGTLRLLQAARHQDAAERFALSLAQMTRERGRRDDAGWLEVPATQTELARLAHLSRQTVNELLQAAQAEGRLRLGRGRLWVRP
ncbi:Crp/Fnr family transcriptional regulator [Roseateles asaccharophilus]|uniref:CRP-like cAMP-binding protein n=1 Tax=Roseateles asaccharophilus TaxID=582607 RepID=A0ABU2AE11_9BURK|nr:Crp/Fnr family transcriptional regulator [Roseateles asaccharophilus]MDR7335429.1 CRP-like cAMP-binding protein [Roseateles asaccharophilus]